MKQITVRSRVSGRRVVPMPERIVEVTPLPLTVLRPHHEPNNRTGELVGYHTVARAVDAQGNRYRTNKHGRWVLEVSV